MADNRIYLKCRGCGKTLFLGKRFGDAYFWENYGLQPKAKVDARPLEDRLNEFYENHFYCDGETPDCFEIEYEIDYND